MYLTAKQMIVAMLLTAAVTVPARAQVQLDQPPPVSPGIPAAATEALLTEFDRVNGALAALRVDLQEHNAQCARVRTDDAPRMQQCRESSAEVRVDIENYQRNLAAYRAHLNAEVSRPPVERRTRDLPQFRLSPIRINGEVYIVTQDGRRVAGEAIGETSIDSGALIVVGREAVQLGLPDGTMLSFRPGSRIVVDEFVYDAGGSRNRLNVRLYKGAMRWLTGQMARRDGAQMSVNTPVASIGPRGTDFETNVEESGDVTVTVYEGEVDVTPTSSAPIVMTQNQVLTISVAGVVVGPNPASE